MAPAITTCSYCTRDTPNGIYLCTDCARRLQDLLLAATGHASPSGRVNSIYVELELTGTKQNGQRLMEPVSGTGLEKALPFRADKTGMPSAAQTAGHLDAEFITVATAIGWWPGERKPRPGRGLRAAGYILDHLGEVRLRPEAGEWTGAIQAQMRKAWQAVDIPAEKLYLGQCSAFTQTGPCTNDLYVSVGRDTCTCRQCGAGHDVADRRGHLLQALRDHLDTATGISAGLGRYLGHRLPASTIRSWVHRERLVAHGVNADGDPMYSIGEVIDLFTTSRLTTM